VIPLLQDVFGKYWTVDAATCNKLRTEVATFVETFDYELRPFECKGFDLCLLDVGSGSDTKVMAKLVLDWSRKAASNGRVFDDPHFSTLKLKYG
jgi:hypothetical protein